MKITCGFHSIEQYRAYTACGAKELYCGYVPCSWLQKHQAVIPLNRREVLYCNVQIGSESELEILAGLVTPQAPVSITLNSLYYPPALYEEISQIIRTCMLYGFRRFIIADPGLICYLNETGLSDSISMILSGEAGLYNHASLAVFRQLGISRVIFPRFTAIRDLQSMIQADQAANPDCPMEYEAFFLNELCPYQGAFCNSLHCDTLNHICRLPYQPAFRNRTAERIQLCQSTANVSEDQFASGGCGICALWKLQRLGITHLKIVSRGNYTDATCRDIQNVQALLSASEQCSSEAEYLNLLKNFPFATHCSGACYYPEYRFQRTCQGSGI